MMRCNFLALLLATILISLPILGQETQQPSTSVLRRLQKLEEENLELRKQILEMQKQVLLLLQQNKTLLKKLEIKLESESEKIQKKIENPWIKIGNDIKAVVNEVDKYEYGVTYQAFNVARVIASSWNEGIRVMTEPYMTGDNGTFTVGGAMWIWDTLDTRDDQGPYHLYYYSTSNGIIATEGNGLNQNPVVYRRLRQ